MKRRIVSNKARSAAKLRTVNVRKVPSKFVLDYLQVLANARKHGVPLTLSPAEIYRQTGVSKGTALDFERARLFSQKKSVLSPKQLNTLAIKLVEEAYKQQIPNAVDAMLGKNKRKRL